MEPFLGQISLFAFNKIPTGWLPCEGQILPISQNPALFSLLSTTFGGNGTTNFALPDLRGRVPVEPSDALGTQGIMSGQDSVSLTIAQVPPHTHSVNVSITDGTALPPGDNVLARNAATAAAQPFESYASPVSGQTTSLAPSTVIQAGGSQNHENRQPSLALSFCICTNGIYPQRPYS